MVLVILLQRNSNDGLSGLGGGSSSPSNMGQSRGSSNPLTKATAILATLFVGTSLGLAYLANAKNESVIDISPTSEVQEETKVPFLIDEETEQKVEDKVAPVTTVPLAE